MAKKIQLEAEKAHKALLYNSLGGRESPVQCVLCSHLCHIKDGEVGKCLVRKNVGGTLYTLNWGKAAGLAIDPIEKKPFFHFKPGTRILSFGTPGCNFRCLNCQNWDLSQSVRDGGTDALDMPLTTPTHIAHAAKANEVDGIAYTYSEPTIFYEYARDTVLECRKQGLDVFHMFVSNGYFTKQMLDAVAKERLLDGIRIDLKFINEKKYMEVCGGRLNPVMENIRRVNELRGKIAMEIIALIIPGLNDSEEDLREMCRFVASVSKDVPMHFSRFHPDYKLAKVPPTQYSTLLAAARIAKEEGLQYIYIGNTDMPDVENTVCPKCKEVLIKRRGFFILDNVFEGISGKEKKNPRCPGCGHKINIVL